MDAIDRSNESGGQNFLTKPEATRKNGQNQHDHDAHLSKNRF
jgi:hypothetical protein